LMLLTNRRFDLPRALSASNIGHNLLAIRDKWGGVTSCVGVRRGSAVLRAGRYGARIIGLTGGSTAGVNRSLGHLWSAYRNIDKAGSSVILVKQIVKS